MITYDNLWSFVCMAEPLIEAIDRCQQGNLCYAAGITLNCSWVVVATCVSTFLNLGRVGWKDQNGVAGSVVAASVVIVLVTRPGVDGSSDSSGDLICGVSTCLKWLWTFWMRHFGSCKNLQMGLSENRVYSQWNSHLIGIMIRQTIGYNGVHNIFRHTQILGSIVLWRPLSRGDETNELLFFCAELWDPKKFNHLKRVQLIICFLGFPIVLGHICFSLFFHTSEIVIKTIYRTPSFSGQTPMFLASFPWKKVLHPLNLLQILSIFIPSMVPIR